MNDSRTDLINYRLNIDFHRHNNNIYRESIAVAKEKCAEVIEILD